MSRVFFFKLMQNGLFVLRVDERGETQLIHQIDVVRLVRPMGCGLATLSLEGSPKATLEQEEHVRDTLPEIRVQADHDATRSPTVFDPTSQCSLVRTLKQKGNTP